VVAQSKASGEEEAAAEHSRRSRRGRRRRMWRMAGNEKRKGSEKRNDNDWKEKCNSNALKAWYYLGPRAIAVVIRSVNPKDSARLLI
jgi:hypothetical protein